MKRLDKAIADISALKNLLFRLQEEKAMKPYIVSTYIYNHEEPVTRETVVFGLENAFRVFNEKVRTRKYTCVRIDKAKYSEESGVVDYIGKEGILGTYCNSSLSNWAKTETETSDIPWYIDCGDIEETL